MKLSLVAALILASACAGDVNTNAKPVRSGVSGPTVVDDTVPTRVVDATPSASPPPPPSPPPSASAPSSEAHTVQSSPLLIPIPMPPPPAEQTCSELAQDVEATLTASCVACHGNGHREGGFGAVLDVPAMIAQTKIVPRDRTASKLYAVVESGLMPRGAAKLAASAIDAIGRWIECGAVDWNTAPPVDATTAFVGIDARLAAVADDLAAIDADARARTRYIDFSQLGNRGATRTELDAYRNMVSFLLNSLSFEERVVVPQAVGPDRLLARIDLDDYGWRPERWERVIAEYPYAVRYDPSSRRFPHDEQIAQRIRDRTGTEIPIVQADWFLAHAARPPLYYQLLGIPADIDELTRALGVDVDDDIARSAVARAGFNRSGISANNRVIERHDKPDGAFWLSYDFKANVGRQNIFAHPVDFQQDGGEGIFHLPNGLQAYFLLDAQFQRLDKAPADIVTDPNTKDRAVEAGLSCMGGCHLNRGIIVKDDTVRDYVLQTPIDEAVLARTLELYPVVQDMQRRMAADNQRYLGALAQTGLTVGDDLALHELVRAHEDLLDLAGVAAVVGVPADAFERALEDNADAFPVEVVLLRQPGGTIYRDALDARFGEIVRALRLGELLDVESPSAAASP